MKILFILYQPILHERMGVMHLISSLKKLNYDVKLAFSKGNLEKLVSDYRPSIIAFSAMTGEYLALLKVNNFLKRRFKFISVFGGAHATFFPDIISEKDIDAICVGEADIALAEFCERVKNKGRYWETENFIVKYENKIFRNPLRPLVEDLDKLPFADRELMYKADRDLLSEGGKTFFSSRGCPHRCTYCFNKRYNQIYAGRGKIVRFRSPENFIEEIYNVKQNFPMDAVSIEDDVFILKPTDWFIQFGKLYKRKISLPFNCNLRANLVTEEVIALLKEAGLDSVCMAIECSDEKIANDILKRGLTNSQILDVVKILKKYNIKLTTQNMVGMPVRDAYGIDKKTLDFNIGINPIFALTSILYPYPGTEIADYAQKSGFMDKAPILETNKYSTVFKYSKEERRKIENLHKIFGIIVSFPFLRKFCDFLCGLPLKKFYNCLFYFWYGYIFKTKIVPFRSFKKEIGKYFRLWIKMLFLR